MWINNGATIVVTSFKSQINLITNQNPAYIHLKHDKYTHAHMHTHVQSTLLITWTNKGKYMQIVEKYG